MTATRKLEANVTEALRVPDLGDADLSYFCEMIGKLSGITLKAAKHDLVRTRIRSRLAVHGMGTYSEYREYLSCLPEEHEEWQAFINLLTTNKTDFFREPKHFAFIVEKILPEWLKLGEKTFKVWSAASSTGEEAYTLAMVLGKHLPKDRDFKILATDIDTDVINTGANAVYRMDKKVEIPTEYHKSCLDFGRGGAEGWFRIKPHLKEKVIFKRHNLMEMTSPGVDVFDLILCRNVFIYFSPDSIGLVTEKFYQTAKSGGHLMIGHSESLQNVAHQWKLIGPSILRKGSNK